MTSAVGIRTYLGIILLLTVAGSFLMLSPGDVSENLQKGGDSIVGIYAGKSTTRYLCAVLLLLSLLSGVFMSACMGISLFLSLGGEIPTDLAMMPSMTMMLASTGTMLVLEISAYLKFDSYKVINWE